MSFENQRVVLKKSFFPNPKMMGNLVGEVEKASGTQKMALGDQKHQKMDLLRPKVKYGDCHTSKKT